MNLRYIGDVAIMSFEEEKLKYTDYVEQMPEYAKKMSSEGKKCLIFDFNQIRFIPSIAIGHIRSAYVILKEAKLGFYLCNLEDRPKRIIDITIGNGNIPVGDDLDKIVSQYKGSV